MYTATHPSRLTAQSARLADAPLVSLLIAIGVFVTMSGGIEAFLSRQIGVEWNNRLSLVFSMLLGPSILMFATVRNLRATVNAYLSMWPMMLFVAVMIASVVWSADRAATLKTGLQMAVFVSIAVCTGALFSWRTIFRALALSTLLLAVISVLIIPHDGLMTESNVGALRGVWEEKNALGSAVAAGAFACLVVALADRSPLFILGLGFLLGVLILSKSATSLLAAIAGLTALLAIEALRRGPRRFFSGVWIASVVVGAVLLGVLSLGSDVFSVLGREATLTGRTQIWPTLLRYMSEAPILGYGYGAFWSEGADLKSRVELEAGFEVFNSHNSYIGLMLGVGFLGTIPFGFALLRGLYQGGTALYGGNGSRRYILPFLIMGVTVSITESTLVGPDGHFLFALLVILTRTAIGHKAVGNSR